MRLNEAALRKKRSVDEFQSFVDHSGCVKTEGSKPFFFE